MSTPCKKHRDQIPKALLGDLSTSEQSSLDVHLKECATCRKEWEMHSTTLQELHALEDAPVPRHFFVHADERLAGPWHLFRQMAWGWQAAMVFALLVLGVGSVAMAAQLQIRSRDGTLMVRFGKGSFPDMTPPEAIDIAALEARILALAGENSRRENLRWVRALRVEITRSNLALTEQQNALLASAFLDLEAGFAGGMASTANQVRDRTGRSLDSLYRTISLERREDFAALSQRLTRLAIAGELKSNQTNAILETLLQVAELRLTDTPGGLQ